MIKRKRDYILTIVLMAFLGIGLILFNMLAYRGETKKVHITFGTYDSLVSIDFDTKQTILNDQAIKQYQTFFNTDAYPIVTENGDVITIILLGNYRLNHQFQEVEIQINYVNRSAQIVREMSPNNICSREGISKKRPLICLPNKVYVEFELDGADFVI